MHQNSNLPQTSEPTPVALNTLIEELQKLIFSFLDDKSVSQAQLLSHQFHDLIGDPLFWRARLGHTFKYLLSDNSEEPQNYQELYKIEYQKFNHLRKSKGWDFDMEQLLRALNGDLYAISQCDEINQNALYSLAVINGHRENYELTNDKGALAFELASAWGRIELFQLFTHLYNDTNLLIKVYNAAITYDQPASLEYCDQTIWPNNIPGEHVVFHGEALQKAASNGSINAAKYLSKKIEELCFEVINTLALPHQPPRTSRDKTAIRAYKNLREILLKDYFPRALKEASQKGHDEIVKAILDKVAFIEKVDTFSYKKDIISQIDILKAKALVGNNPAMTAILDSKLKPTLKSVVSFVTKAKSKLTNVMSQKNFWLIFVCVLGGGILLTTPLPFIINGLSLAVLGGILKTVINAYKNLSKTYYDIPGNRQNMTRNELLAFNAGTRAQLNWKEYGKAFFKQFTYAHPIAFRAGVEFKKLEENKTAITKTC